MIAWKIWHDARHRFYGSVFFIVAIALLHAALFPFLKGIMKVSDIDVGELPGLQQLIDNFAQYTDLRWFLEIERTALFGIILALGGVLTERRHQTILLTLGFPVRRRTWLFYQFGFVLCSLFVLNLITLPVLNVGGYIFDQPVGWVHSFFGSFLLMLTAAPFVGMTILFTSISGDSLRAFLYSFAFLIFSNRLDYFLAIDPWMPESLMRMLIHSHFQWQAFITIVALSTASLAAAIVRFEKTDF